MLGYVVASASSTTVIVVLVLLVVGLLALLAYGMSRPNRLRPHRPGVTGNRWSLRRRRWQEPDSVRRPADEPDAAPRDDAGP